MFINVPEKVKTIIHTLIEAGYEAYAVGGCVRDSILGREPNDWDITTSAKPEIVKGLFRRTIDTGIQHGTVTVMLEKEGFEVTTYRIDGEYEDARHPKEVTFTFNLLEDLKRRDFTINAMAYNDEVGLVDEFQGMQDIEHKTIRCVGVATERFGEDALRILRAIRFSAQLGYEIEDKTKEAIQELAPALRHISAERIQAELVKLLVSPHPEYIRTMYETGVSKVILPEFDKAMLTSQNNPHHCYSVGEHTLVALTQIREDKVLRLSILLHDLGKPDTKSTDEFGIDHFYGHAELGRELAHAILKRLRFDNDTLQKVERLVCWHDYKMECKARSVRRGLHKIGEDLFLPLLEIKKADSLGQSEYERTEKLEEIENLKKIYQVVLEKRQCLSLKDLSVTGTDLIEAGIKPGKQIGVILNYLLELVLDNPERNEKEILIAEALIQSKK